MKILNYLWRQIQITGSFPDKLRHNFHELTYPERVIYFIFIRPFWNIAKIFFFEGNWGLPGQMYLAERQAIYNAIIESKPKNCFEIGTYTGGGSTFFIASAFSKLGHGQLITLESDNYLYTKAKNYYQKKLPKLNKLITFIHNNKIETFDKYLKKDNFADCVFFDGAENEQQTAGQYNYFLPYFHPNSIIIMHDWNTDKMSSLKLVITNDSKWQIIKELKPPISVGLVIAKRIS